MKDKEEKMSEQVRKYHSLENAMNLILSAAKKEPKSKKIVSPSEKKGDAPTKDTALSGEEMKKDIIEIPPDEEDKNVVERSSSLKRKREDKNESGSKKKHEDINDGDSAPDNSVNNLLDRTSTDYYCKMCDSHMNCYAMWKTHVIGKRHQKNLKKDPDSVALKMIAMPDATILPSVRKAINQENGPIVGLDHIEELWKTEDGPPYYSCFLCSSTSTPATLIEHIISTKHRYNYLKQVNSKDFDMLDGLNLNKNYMSSLVAEQAAQAETEYGQGIMKVKKLKAKHASRKDCDYEDVKHEKSRRNDLSPPPYRRQYSSNLNDSLESLSHVERDRPSRYADERSRMSPWARGRSEERNGYHSSSLEPSSYLNISPVGAAPASRLPALDLFQQIKLLSNSDKIKVLTEMGPPQVTTKQEAEDVISTINKLILSLLPYKMRGFSFDNQMLISKGILTSDVEDLRKMFENASRKECNFDQGAYSTIHHSTIFPIGTKPKATTAGQGIDQRDKEHFNTDTFSMNQASRRTGVFPAKTMVSTSSISKPVPPRDSLPPMRGSDYWYPLRGTSNPSHAIDCSASMRAETNTWCTGSLLSPTTSRECALSASESQHRFRDHAQESVPQRMFLTTVPQHRDQQELYHNESNWQQSPKNDDRFSVGY